MFKQFVTLVRGRSEEAMIAATDKHALPILRQQIRDCARAVEASRRAVAVAMAQNEAEKAQHEKLLQQIRDLEARTISALEQEKEDLAREGAEAVAHLEAERDASSQAQVRFSKEINRLRAVLRDGEARLRQLQRGQRLAAATDKTQKMQEIFPDQGLSSLCEAESTLERLQQRQSERDATARALIKLKASGSAEITQDRLARAGCGTPLRTGADDVLARLKAKSKANENNKDNDSAKPATPA